MKYALPGDDYKEAVRERADILLQMADELVILWALNAEDTLTNIVERAWELLYEGPEQE